MKYAAPGESTRTMTRDEYQTLNQRALELFRVSNPTTEQKKELTKALERLYEYEMAK